MKTRKLLSVLLTLCLLCAAFPALAAPTRDMQALEVTVEGGLTELLEIAVQAMYSPEWPNLLENGFPEAEDLEDAPLTDGPLAQRALAYMLARKNTEEAVDAKAASQLLSQVYTNWTGSVSDDEYDLLEETEEGLVLNAEALESGFRLGVYPYSAHFDGTTVTVNADIYYCPLEYEGTADDLPETVLVWVMNGEFSLNFAPETLFGYTVNAYSLSPVYRCGDFSQWKEYMNTEYEYTVNLFPELGLAENDPAHTVWQNGSGDVTVTMVVKEESLSYDKALSRLMQARPGEQVIQQREFDLFYIIGEGVFEIVVVSEYVPWVYDLTMTFPAERQAEYAMYAEIIRNSLGIWGISNG